jgi:hypothetical protein
MNEWMNEWKEILRKMFLCHMVAMHAFQWLAMEAIGTEQTDHKEHWELTVRYKQGKGFLQGPFTKRTRKYLN